MAQQPQKVSFGFLLVPLQLLDLAGPMDIVHNVSTRYVKAFGDTPRQGRQPKLDDLVAKSLDVEWHHIGPTMDPVLTTGGFSAVPTCTVDDCPKLDYLLVGGPTPEYSAKLMPESMKRFVRERTAECRNVFTTCTGAFVLAAAGVLDGQRATVNHAFVDPGKEMFPAVRWSKDKNWVVSDDGKFLTASGATSGADMMADWIRKQVGEDLFGLVTMLLEYQPRDIDGKPLSYLNGRGEWVAV